MNGHPPTMSSGINRLFDHVALMITDFIADTLNLLRAPGFVRPIDIQDELTGAHLKVQITTLYTIITVDGNDFYFERITGKYDGSGYQVKMTQ